MGVPIKFIAQAAMDEFNQGWGDNTTFFDLPDYIVRVATIVAEFYQKAYNEKYQESRQETRGGDLVGFDEGMLADQELVFKDNEASLTHPVMSFVNDKSGVAFQELLATAPEGVELERTSVHELWQLNSVPTVNRVFWYPFRKAIRIVKKGGCNLTKSILLYIPAVMNECGEAYPDAVVPDGIAEYARTACVGKMKELAQGVVTKEANDLNANKIIQTEANTELLK